MPSKRKRDYRAEYKRRIERALEKGYSRSVARGHARKGRKNKGGYRRGAELGIKAAAAVGQKPGADLDSIIAKDAKYVFGRKPKRKAKDDAGASDYQLRLEELARRDGGRFDWLSEANFIRQMRALGLSEREAYNHWFSP